MMISSISIVLDVRRLKICFHLKRKTAYDKIVNSRKIKQKSISKMFYALNI